MEYILPPPRKNNHLFYKKLKSNPNQYNPINNKYMNQLPNELILEIFNHIQKITDKRQFLKTSKIYNEITKQSMFNYEVNYNYSYFPHPNNYCVEKFTVELCHDSYFNLIPDHYISISNELLVRCLSYYNDVSLLELCKLKGCKLYWTSENGASGGHIPVLEWCKKNKCNMKFVPYYGIMNGHVHVLKWLQNNGYDFKNSFQLYNYAIQSGHLKVLKFLHEIGCNWDIRTYNFALSIGNKELTKYLIDNGCPTN